MTNHDEIDRVLDDALAEYREAEPLAGLEDRVLARLRLQTEHMPRRRWRWSAITALAAILAITALLRWKEGVVPGSPLPVAQKQAPPVEPSIRIPVAPPSDEQPMSTSRAKAAAHGSQPALARSLTIDSAPMGERFPAPAPLKPEERMLLALAATRPEIFMGQPDSDQELIIAPIDITPLVKENGGYQGEN